MTTVDDAVRTYYDTVESCDEHEYPNWVRVIRNAILTETTAEIDGMLPWVKQVYELVKSNPK